MSFHASQWRLHASQRCNSCASRSKLNVRIQHRRIANPVHGTRCRAAEPFASIVSSPVAECLAGWRKGSPPDVRISARCTAPAFNQPWQASASGLLTPGTREDSAASSPPAARSSFRDRIDANLPHALRNRVYSAPIVTSRSTRGCGARTGVAIGAAYGRSDSQSHVTGAPAALS